jgi:DNA-binding CsgD family transcriptional regulator
LSSPSTSTPPTRCDYSRTTPHASGYLLKERVSDIAVLSDAIRRIADGECVIDPTIVSRLMSRARGEGPPAMLSQREQSILALIAEGRSDDAITEHLDITTDAYEAELRDAFTKLGLTARRRPSPRRRRSRLPQLQGLRRGATADDNRRVPAIRTDLDGT